MELSSCPQCSAKRNIPLSFSFFLTNRFHLALSCGHCGARYVPTILQRIVQLVLVLVLGTMFGLLYVPALKRASTLSKIGLFGLQPFRLFALLLLFGWRTGFRFVCCRGNCRQTTRSSTADVLSPFLSFLL